METRPIYQALAEAFAEEGVDTHFTLMGDGNMHFAVAMDALPGTTTIHARHEHCACAMAMGYHSATGKPGIASVTCGPGFTQIMTALASAARSNVPLVVLAGETPLKAKWYGQAIEQQPLAAACGAHYITAHAPERMFQYVREAFYTAIHHRKPVVLGVPYDVQKLPMPDIGPYRPSSEVIPRIARIPPDPAQIAQVGEMLVQARHPIILAGRGVIHAGARDAVEALAEQSGALLATTLLGRGMYDHNPFSLGVCGGFARKVTRELFAESDLIVSMGASLTYHTVDGGRIIPDSARMVQVDTRPIGLRDGAPAADIYVMADALLATQALATYVKQHGGAQAEWRNDALAARIRDTPADDNEFEIEPGTLDPRQVMAELEGVLPGDYDVVSGSGHQSYFHTVMRGGEPARYHAMRDFGAIGNSISYAIGVAVARRNGKVVLFEGDGSMLMHIQELECIKRHGLKLLIVCCNDGAYGAEIHKLRKDGLDDSGAIFGHTDLGAIARGFGLRGENVTQLGQFARLMAEHEAADRATIWNVHVSDQVVNPRMRLNVKAGHGVR